MLKAVVLLNVFVEIKSSKEQQLFEIKYFLWLLNNLMDPCWIGLLTYLKNTKNSADHKLLNCSVSCKLQIYW